MGKLIMPHTLRRKMFKLGGEVKSHGVGLTSGLDYNRPGYQKGGEVAPVGQVGKGPLQMKGPDGKMREMQNPLYLLRLLAPGAYSVGRIGKRVASGGLDALRRYFKPRTGRGPGGERVTETVRRTGLGGKPYDLISKTVRTPGTRLPPGYRDYLRMTPRYLGAGIGGLGVLGGISSLAPRGEPETALGTVFEGLRTGAEGAFNIMTGLPIAAIQSPFRSFEDIQAPSNLIRESIYGPDKVTADDTKGPVAEGIETQEEQFAALKEDAEKRAQLYMELMGEEPDTIGAISRGLIQAGQLYDEDKGAAVGALGMEADAEMQRQKDIESQMKGMAVQDVLGADTARKQLVDQAKLAIVSSPDLTPDARSQALKGIEAYEQGIIDTLPLNAKQDAADLNKMRAGSVYFDPYNIYGGMYVAVSSNNQDPEQVKGFSDITEAQAHAAG